MKQTNSTKSVRLFVAVPLPEHIAEELERWTLDHKKSNSFRKWTHPRDYHITLQFLGETSLATLEELQAALRMVRATPISLSLNGIGTFGPPKAPRVLWSAVTGELDKLTALHLSVIDATRPLGYVPEDRPYTSHITLARGYAEGVAALPAKLTGLSPAPTGTEWEAHRFVLMQTHMNSSPMYEIIGEYPLNGNV